MSCAKRGFSMSTGRLDPDRRPKYTLEKFPSEATKYDSDTIMNYPANQ